MSGVAGVLCDVGIGFGITVGDRNGAKRAARPRRPGPDTSLVVTGAINPIPRSLPLRECGIGLLAPEKRDGTGAAGLASVTIGEILKRTPTGRGVGVDSGDGEGGEVTSGEAGRGGSQDIADSWL